MELKIQGIPIIIDYRKVKNINIYIKPPDGHLLVTAPKGTPQKRIESIIDERIERIKKSRERVIQSAKQREAYEEEARDREKMEVMIEAVKVYADKWEAVMGVHAVHWTIRPMKTRWGSCSVHSGRIRLNSRLSAYPEECLEYVIVHELCHLLEPSHNQRFHDYMTRFLPDWKERKKQLGTG